MRKIILPVLFLASCKITAQVKPRPAPAPSDTAKILCVIDSGADLDHSYLIDKIKRAIDYTGDGPSDGYGHGTMVTGIAAQCGFEKIILCKSINNRGLGYKSYSAKCFDYCREKGAHAINASFGSTSRYEPLELAVERAVNAGIRVTASAGNRGNKSGLCSFPGMYSGVINVGAITNTGARASFTSTSCDIKAWQPGVNIKTTKMGNRWGYCTGTSCASPREACELLSK